MHGCIQQHSAALQLRVAGCKHNKNWCMRAGVAFLESRFNLDLQHAMLLVPTAYALSGIAFYGAEAVMKREKALKGSPVQ